MGFTWSRVFIATPQLSGKLHGGWVGGLLGRGYLLHMLMLLYSGVAWDLLYMYLLAEIENTGYMCGNSTGDFMMIIANLHQSI